MLRAVAVLLAAFGILITPARAQHNQHGSECLAMAQTAPHVVSVALRRTALASDEVAITYAGHSTYVIDTPRGLRIATDYSGAWHTGRLPDVVSMNRAH